LIPDERMKKILTEAAVVGSAVIYNFRVCAIDGRNRKGNEYERTDRPILRQPKDRLVRYAEDSEAYAKSLVLAAAFAVEEAEMASL